MHEDQIHVDILSGEQRGFLYNFSILQEMEEAQQKRGESILYIFSAIEQSPRSADRQTPQRDWERQRWREKEEERESLSVRLQGSMLRLMVLWYIFVCVSVCVCVGSAVSSLGPCQGPHSARSLWLSSLEGGHSWWGHDSLCPPRQSQHEQGLLNLAFSGPLASLFLFYSYALGSRQPKNEAGGRKKENKMWPQQKDQCRAKRKMETLLRFSGLYSSSGVISEVCLCI